MAQTQNNVPLILVGVSGFTAIATGNNAAWLCPCGRKLPLIGRSGLAQGVTDGFRVNCPDCDRRYFVVPNGGDQKQVLRVQQLP
jgi:hypothetical protein